MLSMRYLSSLDAGPNSENYVRRAKNVLLARSTKLKDAADLLFFRVSAPDAAEKPQV